MYGFTSVFLGFDQVREVWSQYASLMTRTCLPKHHLFLDFKKGCPGINYIVNQMKYPEEWAIKRIFTCAKNA